MANSGVSPTMFVEDLHAVLQERKKLVDMLFAIKRPGESPEQILCRVLHDRSVVVDLLKESGAVKQVGIDDIPTHLDWLAPKFLKPIGWPGKKGLRPEEKKSDEP
jgi:hypothetical protein